MSTATFPKKSSPNHAKVVAYTPKDFATQSYMPAIVAGLGVSLKHFFTNTRDAMMGTLPDPTLERFDEGITTINYPEQKRPYPERFRGLHRLTVRDDGTPRCVACMCCSTACPAQCISIDAGEYPEGNPSHGHEKYPVNFVIDELRCIFCGYCVEACPCDAIRMDTGVHAVPYDSREQFIYDRSTLMSLTGRDGVKLSDATRHEPGDASYPGVTREQGAH